MSLQRSVNQANPDNPFAGRDFSAPGSRVFLIVIFAVIIVVAMIAASQTFLENQDLTENFSDLTDAGTAQPPESDPVLVGNDRGPVISVQPQVMAPQAANEAEPPSGDILMPPMPAVRQNIPQTIYVLDYEGRPVGPVTVIDPLAPGDQNIEFSLSPELAEYFNFDQGFTMPLDDLGVVSLPDDRYALQLDERQTRYLASYLLSIRGEEE